MTFDRPGKIRDIGGYAQTTSTYPLRDVFQFFVQFFKLRPRWFLWRKKWYAQTTSTMIWFFWYINKVSGLRNYLCYLMEQLCSSEQISLFQNGEIEWKATWRVRFTYTRLVVRNGCISHLRTTQQSMISSTWIAE